MTIKLIMDDEQSEDKETLKKINDEIHDLNEKVKDLSNKIESLSQQHSRQENREIQKNLIKEKCERQSNYCYALGGTCYYSCKHNVRLNTAY
jgi:predicted nuclease with TOPRIM domain